MKLKKLLDRIKASFRSRKFKGGAYATTISAIVIVIVVIINLFATELDVNIDMTAEGKYSLTEETEEMLANIEGKITIYYLAQSGSEYEEFKKILENYPKASKNISLEYKDPVLYPKFASQFVDDTISEQSVIVVNETTGQAKYVDYSELVVSEMDYQTYEPKVTGLDVEGRVDAAIQYVTNDDLPIMYEVSGHGETAASSTMKTLLNKENITLNSINTLTSTEIPEDCDILYINQPQSDYSEDEIALIQSYLKAGGDAILNVDYVTADLPNFNAMIASYGVDVAEGIVLEGDSNYYRGNYMNELVPSISSHDFTEGIRNKKFIVSPVSAGLLLREDKEESITANTFLTTSEKAFSKTNLQSNTTSKEDGDVDGPFYLGVDLVKETDEDEMRLVIFSGKYIFDDSYLSTNVFGNQDLLINTINNLSDQENTVSIRTTSLSEESLVLTSAQKNRNGAIIAIIIPLAFIVCGVVVTVRRRKM